MKAGIIESDRVVTVSPHYALELVGEETGVELDHVLRMTGVTGIVNGMDVNEWNPSTDKYISTNYDAATVGEPSFPNFFSYFLRIEFWSNWSWFQVMDAKPLNKEALQAEVGLPVDRNIPVIAFLGRLEEQKGSDIFAAAIPEFMDENVQVIVLVSMKLHG